MILSQAVLAGDLLRHLTLGCPLLGDIDTSFWAFGQNLCTYVCMGQMDG